MPKVMLGKRDTEGRFAGHALAVSPCVDNADPKNVGSELTVVGT